MVDEIIHTDSQWFQDNELMLFGWIEDTIFAPDGSVEDIRKLFGNDSWENIVEKFNKTGTARTKWWIDAVKAYIELNKDNP